MHSLSEHELVPDKFTYAALLHCCSKAHGDERVGDKATQAGYRAYSPSYLGFDESIRCLSLTHCYMVFNVIDVRSG